VDSTFGKTGSGGPGVGHRIAGRSAQRALRRAAGLPARRHRALPYKPYLSLSGTSMAAPVVPARWR
jgi:hypothetical protein